MSSFRNANFFRNLFLLFIIFASSANAETFKIEETPTGSKFSMMTLDQLTPMVKGTPFEKIKLTDLTAEHVEKTFVIPRHVILQGKIDLSAIKLEIPWLKGEQTKNLIVTATIYSTKKVVIDVQLTRKVYKPFSNISIPGVPSIDMKFMKNLTVTDCSLGLRFNPKKDKMIYLEGGANIFNLPLSVRVMYWKTKDKSGPALKVMMPKKWKFSDSFPKLTFLDKLEFEEAFIYFSSIEYEDSEIETRRGTRAFKIKPGLTLYGNLNLKKAFPILKNAKAAPDNIVVYGTISKNPKNIMIGADLPNLIKFKNGPIKSGGTAIEISGAPSIFLLFSILVKPSAKDPELRFTSRLGIAQDDVKLAFTMQGFWEDVFGIEGIDIGDLALQVTGNPITLLTTGIPSGVGAAGTLVLGTRKDSKKLRLVTIIGDSPMFDGKFDGSLSMDEIVDAAKGLAINVSKRAFKGSRAKQTLAKIDADFNKILSNPAIKKILKTTIRNVQVTIVPEATAIGEFEYLHRGITIRGELDLLGTTAGINVVLSKSGVTAEGWVTPFKIGKVFSLTGSGLDKKYGTNDDAAIMSLNLNLYKQGLIISGIAELLGIRQQTEISLDKDGFKFFLEGKIKNLFEAKVDVKSIGNLKKPDLIFYAHLKNDFREALILAIKKALDLEGIQLTMHDQLDAQELLAANLDIDGSDFRRLINKPLLLAGRKERQARRTKRKARRTKRREVRQERSGKRKEVRLERREERQERRREAFQKIKAGFEDLGEEFRKIGAQALIRVLQGIHFKEMSIQGSVRDMAKGSFPELKLKLAMFKKTVDIRVQADLDDIKGTIKKTIRKILDKIKLGFKGKL